MALLKPHNVETLQEFQSLKFSYDSTNTHYFTGGTSIIVEGTPDVLYTDIAFIKPLSCIYTHAKLYHCPVLEYDSEPIASSGNLMTSGNIKSALDNNQRVFYAVTETAGATSVKQFNIPNFPTETINGVKTPLKGTILIAQCTNTDSRTAQLKFKVNDGGEFPIWHNLAEYDSTSINDKVFGNSVKAYTYTFNGTHWCFVSHGSDNNTTYSAGTGLKLSNSQFSLNVPRVAKSANSLPGQNTAIIEEYTSGSSYNLPTNAFYHILTFVGSDNQFATQLALGMTMDVAFYRRYASSVWQPWLRLDNPTVDATPTASSTNPVQSGGTKTYVDNAVATKSNVIFRQWVTQ